MENKIEEVQEYFKEKIINAEYEIVQVEKNLINIIIDDIYKFHIANYEKEIRQFLCVAEENFILLTEFTEEEGKISFENIEDELIEFQRKHVIEQKKKEIERLSRELEEMESKDESTKCPVCKGSNTQSPGSMPKKWCIDCQKIV